MRERLSDDFESRKIELVRKIGLEEQWKSQIKTLRETGVLEILSDRCDLGVLGIDGREYPVPRYEEIIDRITPEKLELLDQKKEQSFSSLILVPMAMSFEALAGRYKKELLKKSSERKLFNATSGLPLEVDNEDPVVIGKWFRGTDAEEKLLYYPRQFSNSNREDIQGRTKKELIHGGSPWEVLFVEDLLRFPEEGKIQKTERTALPKGLFVTKYLNIIVNNDNYIGEVGLTLESWLIYALTHLHEKNQQIDCLDNSERDQGQACYLIGSFLPLHPQGIPRAFWDQKEHRLDLGNAQFNHDDKRCGTRFAVRI